MPEFTAANITLMHRRLEKAGTVAMTRGVKVLALAGEKQAKINASTGSHKQGTPTPAVRGETGPAVVTGNLRRSISHDPVTHTGTVIHSRIGVARSALYGKYVEDLGYEFLKPVVEFLRTIVRPQVHAEIRRALRNVK